MSLHLGIGIRLGGQQGGAAPFTPASLTPSAWYDPSDISTLFQDSAGTTPVTATGQPVGKMLDISGNGNHLIQPTAAARPLYTVAGAVKYLQFDGVDDSLQRTFTTNFTGGVFTTLFAGRYDTGTGANSLILDMNLTLGNSYDNATGATLLITQSGTQRSAYNNVNGTGISVAADADTVMRNSINANNFVQQLDALAEVISAHGLTPAFNSAYFALGSTVSGISCVKGRCHGVILLNRTLTAGEIASTRTYLGAKQGRTI
jgi:hypothetical protein